MIKENKPFKLGLCLLDKEGKVFKTLDLSGGWSVTLEEGQDIKSPNFQEEICRVLKSQVKLCIEQEDVIEKLLFGDE